LRWGCVGGEEASVDECGEMASIRAERVVDGVEILVTEVRRLGE
jgi:hypothetical protein